MKINFIVSLLFLQIISTSCKKDPVVTPNTSVENFYATEVSVMLKQDLSSEQIFDFINKFDLKVENIGPNFYLSDLPKDSLEYVLNYVSNKEYTKNAEGLAIEGFYDSGENKISINTGLYNMENKSYQADWLDTIKKLKLSLKKNKDYNNSIFFRVSEGKEKEWVEKFKNYDVVEEADLHYYVIDYI